MRNPIGSTVAALTAATGEKLSESPLSKTDSTMEESIFATADDTFTKTSAKYLRSTVFE